MYLPISGVEEELAVRAPIVLAVLDADRVESPLDGGRALVRREDPLTGRDERARCLCEIHGRRIPTREGRARKRVSLRAALA